jgi:ATP-dependent protease ClpP protease subunit
VASGNYPYYKLLQTQLTTSPQALRQERIKLIQTIQNIRQRPLVVYSTNIELSGPGTPAFIHPQDIIPLSEVLDSVTGDHLDFLLETPGGLAEVTVDIVNLLRPRFKNVAFIVPHMAMSAGTILVMSGDEILMDNRSSLGAIDPQFLGADGRPQPAQAILAGIETIKQNADKNNGNLHPVYIPILRNVDPGKLQSAHNASELSKQLVSDWLVKYKFQDWTVKETSGAPVTVQDREQRASEIAASLCDHQNWLSHARPIKVAELEEMKLKIVDYGKDVPLQEAIWALWVHLHHAMTSSNIFKIYESEKIEFYKLATVQNQPPGMFPGPLKVPIPQPMKQQNTASKPEASNVVASFVCNTCGTNHSVQLNFAPGVALTQGAQQFPKNGLFSCQTCKTVHNLIGLKMQVEASVGRQAIL